MSDNVYMDKAATEAIIREKFIALAPVMDERPRRLWAATEAKALGHSGQTLVARATGMSRSTLHLGLRELAREATPPLAPGRLENKHLQRCTQKRRVTS